MNDKSELTLIAGPHRSGAGGDPQAMAAGLARIGPAARPVFAAGHLPVTGERIALPVLCSSDVGPIADQVLHPAADRLLAHCDAVLRLPGHSAGADRNVATARSRGLPPCYDVTEMPHRTPQRTS